MRFNGRVVVRVEQRPVFGIVGSRFDMVERPVIQGGIGIEGYPLRLPPPRVGEDAVP